jgi:hypothetical protein
MFIIDGDGKPEAVMDSMGSIARRRVVNALKKFASQFDNTYNALTHQPNPLALFQRDDSSGFARRLRQAATELQACEDKQAKRTIASLAISFEKRVTVHKAFSGPKAKKASKMFSSYAARMDLFRRRIDTPEPLPPGFARRHLHVVK